MEIRQDPPKPEQSAEAQKIRGALVGSSQRWSIEIGQRQPFRPESAVANLGCDNCCCFLVDTPILLADGSTKCIDGFSGGEKVRTLTGTATVERLEIVRLGLTRRVVELVGPDGESLYMTDDHPLWTRFAEDEWWGTYNFNHYLYEKTVGGGSFLERDALPLLFDRENLHAHVRGWHATRPLYHQAPPETPVYHLALDRGGSYVAGGFVVISHCRDEDVAGAQWRGLDLAALREPAETAA